ncbi:MAG: hypothetical protein ABFC96_12645, partial [Thermoguttaceae bacterium]
MHVDSELTSAFRPWPHRLAWLLLLVVIALISMGGTVTTYEAGMAVRDWPTTFDYWFYPIRAWLAVWDVFLEHGHRLLGQLAGLLAMGLAILLWRDDRQGMRWVAAGLLLGIAVQGTLGGLRVVVDNRVLARIHGCVAPLYFALCTATVVWTSRRWRRATLTRNESEDATSAGPVAARAADPWATAIRSRRLAWLLVSAIYIEIVLGALLRRPSANTTPANMNLWLWLKVINAALILILCFWLLASLRRLVVQVVNLPEQSQPGRQADLPRTIRRGGRWLAALLMAQLVLAAATWVTNYGWPDWFACYVCRLSYTVVAQGRLQVFATTAHAAAGSLLLGLALSLILWLRRWR